MVSDLIDDIFHINLSILNSCTLNLMSNKNKIMTEKKTLSEHFLDPIDKSRNRSTIDTPSTNILCMLTFRAWSWHFNKNVARSD